MTEAMPDVIICNFQNTSIQVLLYAIRVPKICDRRSSTCCRIPIIEPWIAPRNTLLFLQPTSLNRSHDHSGGLITGRVNNYSLTVLIFFSNPWEFLLLGTFTYKQHNIMMSAHVHNLCISEGSLPLFDKGRQHFHAYFRSTDIDWLIPIGAWNFRSFSIWIGNYYLVVIWIHIFILLRHHIMKLFCNSCIAVVIFELQIHWLCTTYCTKNHTLVFNIEHHIVVIPVILFKIFGKYAFSDRHRKVAIEVKHDIVVVKIKISRIVPTILESYDHKVINLIVGITFFREEKLGTAIINMMIVSFLISES